VRLLTLSAFAHATCTDTVNVFRLLNALDAEIALLPRIAGVAAACLARRGADGSEMDSGDGPRDGDMVALVGDANRLVASSQRGRWGGEQGRDRQRGRWRAQTWRRRSRGTDSPGHKDADNAKGGLAHATVVAMRQSFVVGHHWAPLRALAVTLRSLP